jgi:ElaB/YqjD/DUF883 family membrane-anchored ribosome-binding protein
MRTKSGNGHKVDLEQLLDDLKTVVHDGEQLLKASVSTMKERAISSARTTDRVVREHPYQTVALVFGVGVVLGLLAFGLYQRERDADMLLLEEDEGEM